MDAWVLLAETEKDCVFWSLGKLESRLFEDSKSKMVCLDIDFLANVFITDCERGTFGILYLAHWLTDTGSLLLEGIWNNGRNRAHIQIE